MSSAIQSPWEGAEGASSIANKGTYFPQARPSTPSFPNIDPIPSKDSLFRKVFCTTEEMKKEFVKFLTTIFFVLDEEKVLAFMGKLLADPNKSDEEIYNALKGNIKNLQKRFPLFHKLKSLFVLKKGLSGQAAALTKGLDAAKFRDYMEIYDRRYLKNLRAATGMPLDKNCIAVANNGEVGMRERLEAGALLARYPYRKHVGLNDEGCNPFTQPEASYRPIPDDEVEKESIDLLACLGGLHHIPKARMDAFISSMHRTLRPGAVLLMREHDAKDESLKDIAAAVHSFVNASDDVPWTVEQREVRDFRSMQEWTEVMSKHGFQQLSSKSLVLTDDPTKNAMTAFVKTPQTIDELRTAMNYRKIGKRPKDGTRATWIEWGNVRFSKQYAEFIQDHHDHAFDYVGHLRQHWQHFYHYIKEGMKDPEVKLSNLIFSDNMAMNIFILFTASLQCCLGAITSLPSRLVARWKHGPQWREVADLSTLEKFHASAEKEYSQFIEHTPFYMFDYMAKIKEMWRTVWHSSDGLISKSANTVSAAFSTISFLAKAAISAPVKAIYTSEANLEPDSIDMLIKDPNNELSGIIDRWNRAKDPVHQAKMNIETLYSTQDHYKLISVPRYRPFTEIAYYMSQAKSLEILEIGHQKEISIDVAVKGDAQTQPIEGAAVVYEQERLQSKEKMRFVTYQVQVASLAAFQQKVGVSNSGRIEYIHE